MRRTKIINWVVRPSVGGDNNGFDIEDFMRMGIKKVVDVTEVSEFFNYDINNPLCLYCEDGNGDIICFDSVSKRIRNMTSEMSLDSGDLDNSSVSTLKKLPYQLTSSPFVPGDFSGNTADLTLTPTGGINDVVGSLYQIGVYHDQIPPDEGIEVTELCQYSGVTISGITVTLTGITMSGQTISGVTYSGVTYSGTTVYTSSDVVTLLNSTGLIQLGPSIGIGKVYVSYWDSDNSEIHFAEMDITTHW